MKSEAYLARLVRSVTEIPTLPIDKGIPIPPVPKRTRSTFRYPFAQMEMGDSVFVPLLSDANFVSAMLAAKPRKFTIRKVTENGVLGKRIWRIE